MTTPEPTRANAEDSLGQGIDAVVILVLFGLAGFGLDALFGTLPVLTIALVVLGAVGLFARFKYRYEARMDQHEEALRARRRGGLGEPAERRPSVIDDQGAGRR